MTAIPGPFATLKLGQAYTVNMPATLFGSKRTTPSGTCSWTLAAASSCGSSSCASGSMTASTSFFVRATATVLKCCNVSAGNLDFGAVGDLNTVVNG